MWIVLSMPAFASPDEGYALTVRIVDADTGDIVPYAELVHPLARDRHAVDAETGSWTGSLEYMPDGSEQVFNRGMTLQYEVLAPGYAPLRATYTLRGDRRQRLTLALEPLDWPTPTEAAPPIEHRLHAEYDAWIESARTADGRRNLVRLRVAALSEEWLAWVDETGGDRTLAEQVCRLAASHPERCAP